MQLACQFSNQIISFNMVVSQNFIFYLFFKRVEGSDVWPFEDSLGFSNDMLYGTIFFVFSRYQAIIVGDRMSFRKEAVT